MTNQTQLVAISVRQPYAALIMLGLKRIETKATNTKHRGIIMIHASSIMGPAERHVAELEGFNPDKLPRGALLGAVDLEDATPVEKIECLTPEERQRGDYSAGRWGWALSNRQPLPEPIPCKGALSFWKVPADIAAKVCESIRILERVFVYGTLKRHHHNHRLVATSRFVGASSIKGRMHSLGSFPAVALVGRKDVQGEVYAVDHETMERLDRLEGCPSFYQRTRVRMSTGDRAWVYVMSEERLRGHVVIESGRWG